MSNWRNRIIGTDSVSPSTLIPNPLNYKDHPDYQQKVMGATLDELGWLDTVIVNKPTGRIIDGHMRVLLAIQHGEEEVPITYVELTEEEEKKALATFDPIGTFAKDNSEKVKSLLAQVAFNNLAISDMAMKLAQSTKAIVDNITGSGAGGEPNLIEHSEKDNSEIDEKSRQYVDTAMEKYPVEIDQIWSLGKHILICGDCKDSRIQKAAIGSGKIRSINTDPPYGIDIVGSDGRIGYGAKFGDIEGDKEPFDPTFLLQLSDNIVLWGANHYSDKLPSSPSWLIWDKREGDRRNDQADCELAWCSPSGVARIFHHLWMGFARASEQNVQRVHPTQKPIAVIAWSINEKTTEGDIVYDPYCGSGTTIIACEQTGRVCVGVEKSPKYVASALLRFFEQTGTEPKLVGKVE